MLLPTEASVRVVGLLNSEGSLLGPSALGILLTVRKFDLALGQVEWWR